MNQSDRYFFYSGLISLSFFASLILLLLYSVAYIPKSEQYAMYLSDTISVSIDLSPKPVNKSKKEIIQKQEPKQEQTKEPIKESVDEPVVKTTPKEPVISDLFSQISSDIPSKKRAIEKNSNLDKIEKEILSNKAQTSYSQKASNIDIAKPSVEISEEGGSTGPQVNQYNAMVRAIIERYFMPPSGTVGATGRIRVKISASGELLAYRIIKSSKLGLFNNELEWLHDRLKGVKFPPHPDSREANLEFILNAKDR